MRTILLAAGFGKRLMPLTKDIPKCLVPINGVPLLEIWLTRLIKFNLGPFLINTHYMSGQVESYINGSQYSKKITIATEPVLMGTAGTLVKNLNFFQGKDGLLIHSDNYCMADFNAFTEAHQNRPKECLLTMMTFRTNNPSSCGIVELNQQGIVTGFYEKVTNPPGNLANGAIYILSAELLEMIKKELYSAKDFSTEILSHLIGRIYTYETQEIFIDIGTPEAYKQANS
ncbi:MAG: nucleotidyltransferase family protein [Methylophilaceae bacterium]|jgi:mannose-1-phosphate guanylyltransferase|nr:nucleotidyltransferase family protein [Methylophilaceae bacterium]